MRHPVTPSRRRVLVLLTTAAILLVYLRFTQTAPRISSPSVLQERTQTSADVCHIIGFHPSSPDLWQFSTRSLCLSSSICLSTSHRRAALYHASDLSTTKCYVNNPDFTPTNLTLPAMVNSTLRTCRDFQHDLVHCAHGSGLSRNAAVCPKVNPIPTVVRDTAKWLDDLSIVVPDYAFARNIYHYANPIADLARTVDNLPSLLHRWGKHNLRTAEGRPYFASGEFRLAKLNIVFRGLKNIPLAHRWKQELLELMIHQRMEKQGISVELLYLPQMAKQTGHICLRNAVVLGRRGHVNVWPFPNSTDAPLDGFSVPADAITFKSAVYDAFSIQARLPSLSDARAGRAMSELPPFTVAYAKREGMAGEDGYFRAGAMRRFLEEDEEWFTAMLRNETKAAGAKLIVISANANQSLKTQVEMIVQAGFVVGIHGANLVNAIFMHPFGVLMELLPRFVGERCYVAGANSGLKYLRFESSEEAGVVESGCYPKDAWCKEDYRQRLVKLGAKGDREKVREMVREGIQHLQRLWERFPNGVPVGYNEQTVYYGVREVGGM